MAKMTKARRGAKGNPRENNPIAWTKAERHWLGAWAEANWQNVSDDGRGEDADAKADQLYQDCIAGKCSASDAQWLAEVFGEVWDDTPEAEAAAHKSILQKTAALQERRNPALGHGRALTKKDKQVLAAFLDQRELESKKLYTDGKRLDGLWMGGTGIAKWNDAGTVFTFTDLGSRAAQQIQRAVDKAADKKWGSIQRNPCGRPHSKEPNMLRMTKSRVKFIAFLEDTLIPDLYESGTDATAETFEQLVAFLKGAGWSPEGQTREDFMYFLQYTLIPDMRESGSIYTANDLARGLRYLERDAGQRRNPSAKWLARAGGSDVNRYAELEEKLGEVHLYIREDTKRDARRTALEYEPGKVTYIEKIKDGLWNVWIKPEGGTPRQRNGIGRDGRAAIGAAIGGAVGGGYYGGLGGGLGAAAGSLVGAHMAELVGAVKGVGEGATKARRRELVSETKEDVKELKKETREAVREKRAANSDTGAAARRVTVRRRR